MFLLILCIFSFGEVFSTDPPVVFKGGDRFQLEVGSAIKLTTPIKNSTVSTRIESSVYKTNGPFKRCASGSNELDLCLQWGEFILNITAIDDDCNVVETSQPPGGENSACFSYGQSQWFGGAERYQQEWPVQTATMDSKAFLTGYDWQSVTEPFWFNSDGFSVHVDPATPLFVDSNIRTKGELCFLSRVEEPYSKRDTNLLRYEICRFDDAVAARKAATNRYFGKPTGRPSDAMFKEPIYSTWVRYGRDINQDKLNQLVEEIQSNSYPVGQIEIDDTWEQCYGASEFDKSRFPDIKKFTDKVHSLGGRVTAWIYPFINKGCNPAYQDALDNKRFIETENGETDAVWWCGTGGAVDFTKPDVAAWWVDRTRKLRDQSGLDSFKFDAGEVSYLPATPQLTGDIEQIPNNYVRSYVRATSNFSGVMEVRAASGTQDIPVFLRMLDKDSRFGLNNGLQSVVTSLFQMNMVGYTFILPDMIGGNAYGGSISKELFIRWLQASTFMPALQFSVLPWDYDAETTEIARQYLALHSSVSDLILKAADKAVDDGTPINTPIWWIAPQDQDALKCRDEYLLAEKYLVAPVLVEGATQRDIYLPTGSWLDGVTAKTIEGPTWLRNYSAPLNVLPYFSRK